MRAFQFNGPPTGLIKSAKTGWSSGKTTQPMLFVHGGPMDPSVVQHTGLSPTKATEYLVDPTGKTISGGKMLFSFFVCNGTTPPDSPEKPNGVKTLWGLDGHMYVFKVPAQAVYWSKGGMITTTAEVAWEYEFDSNDIVAYWAPSKNYVPKPGEHRDPRKNFQAVSWQQYLVSRMHV